MGKPRRGSYKACARCGAEFYRKPSHVSSSKYCSRECQFEAYKTGKPRICEVCRKSYYVSPAQVKHRGSRYCSDACKAEAMSTRNVGAKNRKWAGNKIRITRLDTYFSLFIRLRDDMTCQRCGAVYGQGAQGLHNSHFIGRANKRMRFDEENCDAACFGCHVQWETHKATEYREWKIAQLGQERFDALVERSRIPLKVGSAEWAEVAERVRDRLKEINGGLLLPRSLPKVVGE